MRILFLTSRPYLPQKIGGAESNTHETILALKNRGNFCAVLAGLSPENSFLLFKNRFKFKFLNQSVPIDYMMGYPVARVWNVSNAIAEINEHFAPDVAVLLPSDGHATEFTYLLARCGIKSVLHLHDVEFSQLGDPHYMHLSGVFANSNFTAKAFQKKFNLNSFVSYNIFRRENYACNPIGRYVSFINPVNVKGRDIAIELARRNPSISFLFIEGWRLKPEEKKWLFESIQDLPNIKWHNRVSDMRKIYALTRILLVPSQWEEAWGRVATEAQISGIPVLASNIGGLPESVGIGGVLIDPKDIEAWDSALIRIWNDEKLWYKLSSQAKVYSLRAELSAPNIAERYEAALHAFINGSVLDQRH